MSFASIALKNVRMKFRSYLIYFFSTVFSVVIFNLFCSIYFNPAFEEFRFGARKMSVLFRGSAIAVFLFAAVFVLYSGSYFIKTQKKELAVYSLLGMRKGQIAIMMFLETFFLGLLALVCGITLGTLTSGYFTSLLLRFMAEGTAVTLSFSPQAVGVTLAAFLLLFAVSGIRAYRTIYKYSLIQLLSASKQREGAPGYSPLGAAAALLLLTAGYFVSATMETDVSGMSLLLPAFAVMILVASGTFLLFKNLVPMAVSLLKQNRRFYYRTSNFISTSQIAFRLGANSRLLSVIALLTAVTITMISASYSFYSVLEGDATKSYAPFSYIAKNISEEQHQRILSTVSKIGEVKIVSEDKIELIKASVQNDQYAVKDQQTSEAAVGQAAGAFMMSETMYQRIIAETNTPFGDFAETKTSFTGGLDNESCYFIDGNAVDDYCESLPGQKMNVSFGGNTAAYTVTGAALHKYIGALDLYKCPTVVLSDENYARYYAQAAADGIDIFYAFQFDDNMSSLKTVDAINSFIPPRFHLGGLPENMSYIGIYKANFALFGSYAFIGFFLGTLFLLASGSIMYYKLIIEAQEEAPRYAILRKTGMKKSEALSSVAKQLGLVYGAPLLVGLIHTMFALLVYNRTLGEMGEQTATLQSALLVALGFVGVYALFYALSVKSFHSIVWKQSAAA